MIGSVERETFERTWKIVVEIGVQERHFNDLETRYRRMASTWLLASFTGIGFVVTKTISLPIDRELLVAGIAAAGCVGIILLWVLDLMVYHRLLDSCFIEGLILEDRYPWLPPFRHNMMQTQRGQGVLFRVVGFYLGPITLLILISGGSLSLWVSKAYLFASMILLFFTLVIAFLIIRIIRRKTENTAAIEKRLTEARGGVDPKKNVS